MVYAINSADIPASGTVSLAVLDTAWAGRPTGHAVHPGQCVRIMTGAMMPEGADTVVIQEHVRIEHDSILIDSDVETGRNVRQAGEDVACGEVVLSSGTSVGPAQLGMLASLGIDRVSVRRRPRVAYFTTGDELRSLDQHAGLPLGPGSCLIATDSPCLVCCRDLVWSCSISAWYRITGK